MMNKVIEEYYQKLETIINQIDTNNYRDDIYSKSEIISDLKLRLQQMIYLTIGEDPFSTKGITFEKDYSLLVSEFIIRYINILYATYKKVVYPTSIVWDGENFQVIWSSKQEDLYVNFDTAIINMVIYSKDGSDYYLNCKIPIDTVKRKNLPIITI